MSSETCLFFYGVPEVLGPVPALVLASPVQAGELGRSSKLGSVG